MNREVDIVYTAVSSSVTRVYSVLKFSATSPDQDFDRFLFNLEDLVFRLTPNLKRFDFVSITFWHPTRTCRRIAVVNLPTSNIHPQSLIRKVSNSLKGGIADLAGELYIRFDFRAKSFTDKLACLNLCFSI
jgi:hypothetical protein